MSGIGEIGAIRSTLKQTIGLMTGDQKDYLLNLLVMNIESIEASPNFAPSILLQDYVKGLKSIAFWIRESKRLAQSDHAKKHQIYFVCLKCDLEIIPDSIDTRCPSCGGMDWIERVWVWYGKSKSLI